MRIVKRLLNRLFRWKRKSKPVETPNERREKLLREIFKYTELALAYDTPCHECQRRAAKLKKWRTELMAELSAISRKPI